MQKKSTARNITKEEKEFYIQCAIAAMQGLQEAGKRISLVSDLFPKETAKMAFRMADAMLEEYRNQFSNKEKDVEDWLEKRQLKLDL